LESNDLLESFIRDDVDEVFILHNVAFIFLHHYLLSLMHTEFWPL
jgi:hypothetical protein